MPKQTVISERKTALTTMQGKIARTKRKSKSKAKKQEQGVTVKAGAEREMLMQTCNNKAKTAQTLDIKQNSKNNAEKQKHNSLFSVDKNPQLII